MSESCLDWYTFRLPGGSVTNPMGPASGKLRVKRGGSWNRVALECSSAARNASSPVHATTEGCRIALVPDIRPALAN